MKLALSFLPFVALALGQHDPLQVPLESEKPRKAGPLTIDGIPLLGFGTWNLKTNCTEAVSYAIQTGYRHIDCAAAYGNEELVGQGIQDGLVKAGLTREDIWVTSKLWNDHHGANQVEEAIDESLQKLGVGYLDLYLMHWPVASGYFGRNYEEYRDTWGAMTLLLGKGKAKHIGVSNFDPAQLKDLLNHTSYPPSVHQMELHPYLQQIDWLEFHEKNGIHATAYSPLAGTNPTYDKGEPAQLLNNSVITKIADKRGCTPAQVVLQWGMARGTSVIPKTSHLERVKENFKSPECILKGSDIEKIDDLGKEHHRYNNPSKSWGVDLYEDLEDSQGEHKKHS